YIEVLEDLLLSFRVPRLGHRVFVFDGTRIEPTRQNAPRSLACNPCCPGRRWRRSYLGGCLVQMSVKRRWRESGLARVDDPDGERWCSPALCAHPPRPRSAARVQPSGESAAVY